MKCACAILEWEIVLVGQVHPHYTAISAKVVTELCVMCCVHCLEFEGWEWCVFGDLIMSKIFKLTMYYKP